MSYVYCIRNTKTRRVKLGKGNNPLKRLKTLQTGSADPLVLEGTIQTDEPFRVEKTLHRIFGAYRVKGEWFDIAERDERLLQVIFRKIEATAHETEALIRLGVW